PMMVTTGWLYPFSQTIELSRFVAPRWGAKHTCTSPDLYSGFQMSVYSFENKKSVPLRVLSFHFAYGKMKTAINAIYPIGVTMVII
ncbi:MAG: hypothetical protein ACK45W_07720, partial [Pseudanabaena sp.]